MNENNYKWDLEQPDQRGDMIKTALELFGPDRRMHMRASDCLEYNFDNVAEAISFVIYRVKEVDFQGTFESAEMGNIGSSDMYIYIKDDACTYTLKMLDSYEFNHKSGQERYTEQLNTIFHSPLNDLQIIFCDNSKKYIDNFNNKVEMLKTEVNSHKPCIFEETDCFIEHLLNRYFYASPRWVEHWFEIKPIGWRTNNITWKIRLEDGLVLSIDLNEAIKTSVAEKQKKVGSKKVVIRKPINKKK